MPLEFTHLDGHAVHRQRAREILARHPEVKKLLGRSNVALCNECVSLASDIMEAELGADWR